MSKNGSISFLLIVLVSAIGVSQSEEYPRVSTPLGNIKGYYEISSKKLQYEAYEGIPYAKPPTGELRFEPPVPIEAWTNELNATSKPMACLQFNQEYQVVSGQEDCLYLNVYVPSSKSATPLPVVAWFHGGGFQYGQSIDHRPTHIMNKNVIFITINYRLGPFGFLSTEDEIVPGNMGLKDQSLALQWISKNIEYFGGDPKRVTLTGCSAGGSSVHYHYLSPMSAGLFQNGVSVSGTAFSPWAYGVTQQKEATTLAKIVNCTTSNSEEIVRCLKEKPGVDIANAVKQMELMEYLKVGLLRAIFQPVAEKTKSNYFINRSPRDIVKSGDVYDVPWVAGVVSAEGYFFNYGFQFNQTRLSYIDEHWEELGPYLMMFRTKMPNSRHASAANLARQHYLGDKSFDVSDEVAQGMIDLVSDINVRMDNQEAGKLHAAAVKSPVYFYYYDYKSRKTLKSYGVPHCDDCGFILNNDDFDFNADPENTQMLEKSLNFVYSMASRNYSSWENVWQRVDPKTDYIQYLDIKGPNKITSVSNDNFAERKFWSSVY